MMRKVGSKRQITLPASQCLEVGIKPGDVYRSFVANGCIIIPQKAGTTRGILKNLQVDTAMSDEQSRQTALELRRSRAK